MADWQPHHMLCHSGRHDDSQQLITTSSKANQLMCSAANGSSWEIKAEAALASSMSTRHKFESFGKS